MKHLTKRKIKMNLYLKFDARHGRSSKLGHLMVLDTRKCLKFDAHTRSMLERKVLEVSLLATTNFALHIKVLLSV